MNWPSLLDEATQKITAGDAKGGYLAAYRALETCFDQVAREQGWRHKEKSKFDRLWNTIGFLEDERVLRSDESQWAKHILKCRNCMEHKLGFEPSCDEAERVLNVVGGIVGRFGKYARDVMTREVETVEEDTPIQTALEKMKEKKISQLPVLRRDEVVGVIDESCILEALVRGEGVVPPETAVREVMKSERFPQLKSSARIEEIRTKLAETGAAAVLIYEQRGLVGIITKIDVIKQI